MDINIAQLHQKSVMHVTYKFCYEYQLHVNTHVENELEIYVFNYFFGVHNILNLKLSKCLSRPGMK